jgi:hypothetical protein
MATITPQITRLDKDNSRSYIVFWEAVSENDTCDPVQIHSKADRSFQVTGSFGGGTVDLEGSNDETNYVTLDDLFGDAISFSADGLAGVGPMTRFVRPGTPGGTSADVDCYLFVTGGKISA